MKEPKKIPLTNNPRSKEPEKIPLTIPTHYDIEMIDHLWIKDNENNKQNHKKSISELEPL